jgi:small subunit ribosomal protein S17
MTETQNQTAERGRQRKLVGKVVNDTTKTGRMKQTIVVEVTSRVRDPFYGKYVKRRKRFHAHDEKETYKLHDVVEIRSCRPRSATKRWEVSRLVERPEEV